MGYLKSQRLALNMFWCAFLLGPFGTLPRETISGFFGRRSFTSRFAFRVARFIDWLHPHEYRHCVETYVLERAARAILYPDYK